MKSKKNNKLTNFTKPTSKRGISLIVLVITIIVIIILAAAVILTINNNNPVAEANKARYESDRANMQAIFTNAVAKVMTHNRATVSVTAGQINEKTSGVKESKGTVSYTVTNAMNKDNTSGTIVFDKEQNTDTTFYTGKLLPVYAAGETKWYVDEEGNITLEVAGVKYGEGVVTEGPSSGGSGSDEEDGDDSGNTGTTGSASVVANAPTTYYGQKVTNYTTGNTAIDEQVDWQIFYADTNNIYLIATDYIHYDICPPSANNTIYKNSDYKLSMDDVIKDYNGSEDITDARLQALNKSYHEYLVANNRVNRNSSMKAVAYMLDINIWETFAGNKAEYAIGGPTVEMLMKSYSQKYEADGVDYRAQATGINGYQISKDGGVNWDTYYSGILNTGDTQYVINSTAKASAMWLASPSANNPANVMRVTSNGNVYDYSYNSDHVGFRPLVCLSSNVSLKAVEGGFEIE